MSNIRRVKIDSGAIDGSGDATAYSRPITGKILSVEVDYPSNSCTVDLDSDGPVSQKVLDLSSASTDAVYYPRVAVHDNTGSAIDLSDSEGGNTAKYECFVVSGRVKLTIASGTEDDEVTVYLVVEEY